MRNRNDGSKMGSPRDVRPGPGNACLWQGCVLIVSDTRDRGYGHACPLGNDVNLSSGTGLNV